MDFEGSLRTGIREVGIVIVNEGKISQTHEIVKQKSDKRQMELKIIEFFASKIDEIPKCICSHNHSTENNLLRSIMPYVTSRSTENITWGPWLDTLSIYRRLYPDLMKYDLKSLVESFLCPDKLKIIATRHCNILRASYHHALYDSICCYLLWLRISQKIKISPDLRINRLRE